MWPVEQKGFRPFFLLGACFGVLSIAWWTASLRGLVSFGGPMVGVAWHAHEMIHGFTVAVVAGFLLTAVANWTGRETAVGRPLRALVGLWAMGRVVMLTTPGWIGSSIDLLFLPALTATLALPLARDRNRRNAVFPALLAALWCTNVASHLDARGVLVGAAPIAHRAAVHLIAVVIVVIAGRIVPLFTRNATGAPDIAGSAALDRVAAVATLATAALQLVPEAAAVRGALAGVAAVAVLARTRRWGVQHTLGDPLLWVLHVGHAAVGLGLGLEAVGAWWALPASVWLHTLTVGGIGVLTLGMMARVTLGHTGRPLRAGRALTAAFALMVLAAALRTLGPWAWPAASLGWWGGAALAWCLAIGVYVVCAAPMLLAARPDGRPG